VVHRGLEATMHVLPTRFNWSLFYVALTLMTMPAAQIGWRIVARRMDSRPRLGP